jgi:hypothetical protein
MNRTFEAKVELTLRITINDLSIIDRCVENWDDQGVPQPYERGKGSGWRNMLYNLETAEEVIEMLAYNWVVNDAPAHKLDGWADLEPDWRNPYAAYEVVDRHADIEVTEVTRG